MSSRIIAFLVDLAGGLAGTLAALLLAAFLLPVDAPAWSSSLIVLDCVPLPAPAATETSRSSSSSSSELLITIALALEAALLPAAVEAAGVAFARFDEVWMGGSSSDESGRRRLRRDELAPPFDVEAIDGCDCRDCVAAAVGNELAREGG